PADANDVIHWLSHEAMVPPVSLLLYRPDKPTRAGYFPFAIFSPELQALKYGLTHGIPARFFDLPQAHMLAVDHRPQLPSANVFNQLATAAGHRNYEQWWNLAIEQRQDSRDLFTAVLELMQALRSALEHETAVSTTPQPESQLAAQREAYMRTTIRRAIADGHKRIAVVCGAFHTPALVNLDNEAEDKLILANMPAVEVEAAWVPWTYGRLAKTSGYGAGINSPGWYHHLWQMSGSNASPTDMSINWLTRIATLLRDEDLDASSAHIIETVRLAEALAALRGLPFPGLPELNEATQTVMCGGDAAPMALIHKKLTVGERMGMVPPDTPMVPLQRDLLMHQRTLRLHPDPSPSTLSLDLRNQLDLQRSHLLHRLNLLNITWGKFTPVRGRLGTYQEDWKLQWMPDFAVRIIEANQWGNTVEDAATNYAQDMADNAKNLPTLTQLLDRIILAELPDAVMHLMKRIEDESAISSDVPHMMDAVQPLARVLRYGSVRQTDKTVIQHVVDGLITRVCIGLPSTCAALDDKAAGEMMDRITAVHSTISTLQNKHQQSQWHNTLHTLVDQERLHGILAGKSCRLLLDSRNFTAEEAAQRMERALSFHAMLEAGIEQLMQMAAWVDGFLKGSGLVILHDTVLWQLLDNWLTQLDGERFQAVLPLLRRTFTTFSDATREQMNQLVRHGAEQGADDVGETAVQFNETQANNVLPFIAQLLGKQTTSS
ncbi:MAG: hypothetical protein GY943_13385, partial [Chloroflexi bacterium]|nr:hypothetical protein [Chloroflexota bacterium]